MGAIRTEARPADCTLPRRGCGAGVVDTAVALALLALLAVSTLIRLSTHALRGVQDA